VPRAQRFPRFLLAVAGCLTLSSAASARENEPPPQHGLIFEAPLPGGVRAALDVLNDSRAADRSHFLLDVIRRHHHGPRPADPQDGAALAALIAHLDRSTGAAQGAPRETVPLPLPPRIWIDTVFAGRETEDTLVSAILRSRGAALLYHGLLSLDGETREWLAARPAVLAAIVLESAARFATAAPGFRVANGAVRLPGGEAAKPVWEALLGHPADEPEAFLRALVAPGQGRLAYFVAAMAQLTPPQIAMAMGLDSADAAERLAATRRMVGIFERLGWDWKIEERTFWRPPLDPALLVAELATGADGRPLLPGTRAFWRLAFADTRTGPTRPITEDAARGAASGPPVDFVWLCEEIFARRPINPEVRYQLVLFASRVVRDVAPETAGEAIDAVRTAGAYPALSAALERAGISDAGVFAAAGRRAARLSAIRRDRAHRSLAQFQGTLAIVTRAAARSPHRRDAVASVVSALSAIEPGERGDYEGRLVRWLDALLRETAAAPDGRSALGQNDSLDGLLRRTLAGTPRGPAEVVDWEGTRYRVDLAHAELVRLDQVLGPGVRPNASSALALVRIANALEATPTPELLARHAVEVEEVARAAGWPNRPRAVEAFLRRARSGDIRGAARLAPELRVIADGLMGEALIELTYAAAMGLPERTPISAREAAGRHDFGLGSRNWRDNPAWQPPVERNDPAVGWQISGSLLGLDVRLAPFSLLQLSPKPPPRRPTLNDQDRRTMIETVALIEPAALDDASRDRIVAALRLGRARLAALGTRSEAAALADEIRMSPARRSLLLWIVAHDREGLARFLSAGELLWLGLDRPESGAQLHAWGAPARPRFGCLCLRVVDPRPDEMFSGRWHSGVRASTFPDLSLRLAELLAELGMPAPLLGAVLAPAVLDFVNLVVSRDPDDRRGLVEFVQELRVDHLEQYLAALTTDGPLVPLGASPEPAAGSGRVGLEAPW
jgi:hypothetical protein